MVAGHPRFRAVEHWRAGAIGLAARADGQLDRLDRAVRHGAGLLDGADSPSRELVGRDPRRSADSAGPAARPAGHAAARHDAVARAVARGPVLRAGPGLCPALRAEV